MNNAKSWFYKPKPNPNSKLRLFCFPYAGAGAMVYRDWVKHVPDGVEVYALQAPGRETRFREPLFYHIDPLIEGVMAEMPALLDKPFAFYGHSLGSLVAFTVAQHLQQELGKSPLHLFVSARNAPQTPPRTEAFHTLNDKDFVAMLKELGGMDENILQSEEMMALLLPILRADFQINETYRYTPAPPLTCPIYAFHGTGDIVATQETVAAWQAHTTAEFRLRQVEGGHFFINDAKNAFWNYFGYDLGCLLMELDKK